MKIENNIKLDFNDVLLRPKEAPIQSDVSVVRELHLNIVVAFGLSSSQVI